MNEVKIEVINDRDLNKVIDENLNRSFSEKVARMYRSIIKEIRAVLKFTR